NRLKEFKRPWQLHYACRSREEAAFLNELEKERDAHFHFDIENDGRVLDIRAVVERSPASAHLYCCGPEPMIAAFLDAVGERAISNIHVEYFVAKSQPATSDEFIVELARSGRQFTVCRGKTILETLREAGVDVA